MSDNPLAALAMRERAANELDSEVADLESEASRFRGGTDPHHARMAFARAARRQSERIRALPPTFTDAELLDAAMQLPEVRALIEALNHAQYGLSWAVRYFKDHDVTKDDPCPPCTRGLSATRAAIAPFTKGGE